MFYNFVFHLVIGLAACIQLHSNYNYSLVNEQALLSEPMLLSHRLPNALQRPPLIQHFPLRKYELRDTGYYIDDSLLSQIDHQLIYHMEPPAGVFAFEVMSIQNYHLLQIRQFQIGFTNPSLKFKLCINEIVVDSEEVKRNDERGTLPFCLAPGKHQLFNFSLYISSRHPALVRVTVYFIIEILDGKALVEEKTYARKIYTTVAQNHLRLETIHFKKCPANQNIVFHNYESSEIALRLQARRKLQTISGEIIQGQIRLRPGKEIAIKAEGKGTQFIVHSHVSNQMKKFPSLLMKTHCEQQLVIDYQNIGILTDEKMVIDLPLSVTSRHSDNITLIQIQLQASTQTVQLEERQSFVPIIYPQARNIPIAMIRIHSSKSPERRSTITIKVKYKTNEEQRVAVQRLVYAQIRNAVSAGQKRFIDVTKTTNTLLESRFPIKNNLNVPIYLNKIIVDQSIFQLNWQTERRRLIYPNHSVEEFSLIYTGSLNLPLSSLKYLALLQFNGHIIIPIQITIYDHTLQCLYNNIVHKCSRLPPLDFGYFSRLQSKSKQLVVRNWNPESKLVSLGINQTQALFNGYNATLKVYRPGGLAGDHETKHSKQMMQLMLKPHQFLLLSIEMQPFQNATSGKITLHLDTENEVVGSQLLVHLENGTIALIPQIIRFPNSYSRQIQYINLVSTYSQEYNVLGVSTNLTGLSVHYNQPPTILKNQWVGMSIVYDPSSTQQDDYDLKPLHSQMKYLRHRISQDFQRVKYAKVTLTTTTDLQVNSVVIIQQKFPQIVVEAKPSTELEGVFEIQKLILKRKKKSNKKEERHSGQIVLTISNPLQSAIRYSVNILSQPKLRDVDKTYKQYQTYNSSQVEEGFLCVSEENKIKWGINPNTIKSLFRLQKQPEQCALQGGSQQVIIYNSFKQKITTQNNLTLIYLFKSLKILCKTCYRFAHKPYIHRLIDTELVNKVLQEEGFPVLNEFLKAELNHLQDLRVFQLEYLDFHARIKEDFTKFCQKYPDVMMFRFCHYLNSRIVYITDSTTKSRLQWSPNRSLLIYPGQTHTVTISVSFPPKKEKAQFFMVLSNNFTQFQTYRIATFLQDPFCRIEPLTSQLQYPSDNLIVRYKKGPHQLQVFINKGDYREQQNLIEGSRTFEIINDGQIAIEIAHLGIDEKEVTCSYANIWLNGLTCSESDIGSSDWIARAPKNSIISKSQQAQTFKLAPHQRYNLTVYFQFMVGNEQLFRSSYFPINPQQITFHIYMYDVKGYYFNFNFNFKLGDRQLKNTLLNLSRKGMRQPLISYYSLIVVSLTFICIMLVRLKSDSEVRKKKSGIQQEIPSYGYYRMKKLGKIVRQSNYSDTDSCIGSRLVRKPLERPVHTISQDLLLSVRQVNHRELKKYFNQSQQSEIGGAIGFNHHLSLSHSISYEQEQEEHDNNNHQPNELIQLADSPRIGEESEEPESEQSSCLPDGEQVQLIDDFQQDSAIFDFNRSNSFTAHKSTSSVLDEDQFYNVFRSQVSLKKQSNLDYGELKHVKLQ